MTLSKGITPTKTVKPQAYDICLQAKEKTVVRLLCVAATGFRARNERVERLFTARRTRETHSM